MTRVTEPTVKSTEDLQTIMFVEKHEIRGVIVGMKTISFVKGKGSIRHDNRDFIAENVDEDRVEWNRYYIQQPLDDAYRSIFGPALEEYNAKQKRSDRRIYDYQSKIKNSKNNEKVFYENVVQIGKKDDTGVVDSEGNISEEAKKAIEVLDEYVKTFSERNPNLYLFNAVLHLDEATPHLHLDYIPVAHGYKTGLKTRNSLTKALQEMGIAPAVSKNDTETMHWQERERNYISELCQNRGIEIGTLGESHGGIMLPEYKKAQREVEEMESKLEILDSEKKELQAEINISNLVLAEKDELTEQKEEDLLKIEAEILDSRNRMSQYRELADRFTGMNKAVEQDIEKIRQKAKPVAGFLQAEPMVKIPKKLFENMLEKYRVASVAEKVTSEYERIIGNLREELRKIKQSFEIVKRAFEKMKNFIRHKDLADELENFNKAKSVREQIREKKTYIDEGRNALVCEQGRSRNKNHSKGFSQ